MPRFCPNCGAETDEHAEKCSFCGIVLDTYQNNGYAPQMYQPSAVNQAPMKKSPGLRKKSKIDFKTVIISAVCVLVMAAVIVSVTFVLISYTGYNAMLRNAANAYGNNDYETLMSYVSTLAYPYEDLDEYKEIYGNDYSELIDDSVDTVEDKLGSIKHVSVKIDSKEEVSDSKMKSIIKNCCGGDLDDDSVVFDSSSVTGMYKVNLTVTVKGADKTREYAIKKAYLVKENGTWKFLFNGNTTIKIPGAENSVEALADF